MFGLVLIVLLIFPKEAAEGAMEGISCAFETVIPSILPFAVFSSALTYSGGARIIGAMLSPIFSKVLNLHPYGAAAFIASIIGGYPVGAKVVCDMYKEGLITKKEGEGMLAYCNNGGIVFAVSVIGRKAFGAVNVGILIYAAAVLSSLAAGVLLSKEKYEALKIKEEWKIYKTKKPPFLTVFGKSIASGGTIIVSILSSFIVFYALTEALYVEKIPFLAVLCEVTKGVFFAAEKGRAEVAAFALSFGGLAVFAQSGAICSDAGLEIKKMIAGKTIGAIISFFAVSIFMKISHEGMMSILFLVSICIGIRGCANLLGKILKAPF